MTDERLETAALHVACVVASGFTAFVLGMWVEHGETSGPAVLGMLLVWGILAFGWFSRPRPRARA